MDGIAAGPGMAWGTGARSQNKDKPLSSGACRVFTALTRLAAADGQVTAKYDAIREASGCARGTIARALVELEDAGLIGRTTNYKGRGGYAYTLAHSSISPIVHSSISPIVQPPDLVLGTGTGGGGAHEVLRSPEPAEPEPAAPSLAAESPARQRARALLREFNVGEPTQTDLAAALESRFAQDNDAPATARRICERTREDWHRGWARNPIGLTVARLRRFVKGEQLSFLAELGQPDAVKAGAARGRTRGRTSRRPQVTYTAERREAAEAKAAEALAARASGDDEALRAQIERAEASAQAAQTADRRTYWTDYAARLRVRLGEVATS